MNNFFEKIACDERWFTLSNGITLLRIILAPLVVVSMYYGWLYCSFTLFMVAAVTDFLDGFIARWTNSSTNLGKVLDPIADKLLLLSSFCALAYIPLPLFQIPSWFVVLLLVREVIIVSGATLLLLCRPTLSIDPLMSGKLTTLFQIIFIGWLFVGYFVWGVLVKVNSYVLVALALFSLFSLFQYLLRGFFSWFSTD